MLKRQRRDVKITKKTIPSPNSKTNSVISPKNKGWYPLVETIPLKVEIPDSTKLLAVTR
ncbi:MAG: hypothetical protein Kapaf2KO_12520 [Candidatus Kapaibacteriales bacterium]